MTDVLEDLLEAWSIHNEINVFILDWIPDQGLNAMTLLKTGKPSRGRNVARIFAHMHEVRCARLAPNYAAADELPRFHGPELLVSRPGSCLRIENADAPAAQGGTTKD